MYRKTVNLQPFRIRGKVFVKVVSNMARVADLQVEFSYRM